MSQFKYDYVLVCRDIPSSVINGLSLDEHEPVDFEKARLEHRKYLEILEKTGLKMITIEPNEDHPDCVFVEDTAVCIGNRVFITNPGAESRRNEVDAVFKKFKEYQDELGLDIHQIENKQEAFIDGGDVCFTGREILVGLSTRTNLKGIKELKDFFSDILLTMCVVSDGLHLKSFLSMFKEDTIIIGSSEAAINVRKQIESYSNFAKFYNFIQVQNDHASNVLYFNNNLIYSLKYTEIFNDLKDSNAKKLNFISSENFEFEKIDGCLTCRCIFFNKKKI